MTAPKTVSAAGRWLALIAALLGWMFDGLEMGLFPVVARPALRELLHTRERAEAEAAITGSAAMPRIEKDLESEVGRWFGVITAGFLVGAATGGVLFGWLGDKIGRVKALTLSVIVYAGCSGLCAFVGDPWQLAGLRFAGALGMGGEWALGVALVMELWANRPRAWLAGWIGAFGNLGYFIIGSAVIGLNRIGTELPQWLASIGIPDDWTTQLTANGNWRLLMLVGAVPAVLTLFIRFFVPESEKWVKEKAAGGASHWSGQDLLAVLVGAVAASGMIAVWALNLSLFIAVPVTIVALLIVTAGYLYPARQYLSRATVSPAERSRTLGRMLLAAGLSGVPLLATWAGVMWMYNWVDVLVEHLPKDDLVRKDAKALCQIASSLGAAAGCLVGAVLGGRLGRRPVYAALCVLSCGTLMGFYLLNKSYGWEFVASAGLVGFITAAFYGWLPLYLPELFRTSVRATGQGFGFNFGRILAAVGALQMGNLLVAFDNDYAKACSIAAGIYVVGLVLIYFAPETKGRPLPE